jgi:2-desacetyl-2-hydroxyethyl bacteriochlorophyllide A dehydrogenase
VTPLDARAFWITAPGVGQIREERIAEPSPATDAVVRARFSAVSRGTESLVFTGSIPATEWERMRAPFQEGRFPFPVKYGYCSVGTVESGPSGLPGRTVFCLYPHQTRYTVPADALYKLPDDVPAGRAVLAANMETALNGLWDGAAQPGDRIVVIGAGTVGCLVAFLASRIAGCDVTLTDINGQRATVAAKLGVSFAAPSDVPDDCDLVFHASGSPEGLQHALRIAAFEGTIVEMSWFGTKSVQLSLGEAFHARRLTIRSSQVGHVATSHRARWTHRRRMELALALLRDPALDVLITGESRFDELPAVVAELASGGRDGLCHRIRYDGV